MIRFRVLEDIEDLEGPLQIIHFPKQKQCKYLIGSITVLIFGLVCIGGLVLLLQSLNEPLSKSCTSSDCTQSARRLVDSMNSSVDPCDDFFEFACGGWIANNPVPSDVLKWSHFDKLNAASNKATQDILNQPVQPEDPFALKQAKEFYSACVDLDELDRVGLNPILSLLDAYGGWPMIKQRESWSPQSFHWTKSVADLKRLFRTSALFDIQISPDADQPHLQTIYLTGPSLFVPRQFLLDHTTHASHITTYKQFIIGITKELAKAQGITLVPDELSDSAVEIISLESDLAGHTVDEDTATFRYGQVNEHVSMSLSDLQSIFPQDKYHNHSNKVDLRKLLETTFRSSQVRINDTQLVSVLAFGDYTFLETVNRIITTTSPRILSNYIHFRMLASIASETTKGMREIANKFFKNAFGLKKLSRESLCASSAQDKFGLALSRPYLETNKITHKTLSQVVKMTEDIRQSFQSLLGGVKWMNPNLQNELMEQAASITPCVGFAEWMRPNSTLYEQKLQEHFIGLDLGEGTGYLEKLWRVHTWQGDQKFDQLQKPNTTGCEWISFIGRVNVYYDTQRNALAIPLGILQLPFFYADEYFSSVNFGALGSTIGHELTHGFSVLGWFEKSIGTLTPASQCLANQFQPYKVHRGEINGTLPLDETFADNGGLIAAYKAYQLSIPNEPGPIPGLERLTQDQLFFLGYASTRCSSARPAGLGNQIVDDEHTTDRFRVLGSLQNMKEFAEAWNCPEGSNLNPLRVSRCNIFEGTVNN